MDGGVRRDRLLGAGRLPVTAGPAAERLPRLRRAGSRRAACGGLARCAGWRRREAGCGSQDLITLQVRNGAFDYVLNQPQVPYQPQRAFHVTIAPDGSFRTDLGGAFMSGSVRGGHMSGQIVGDVCSYAFDADSTGTW